MSKESAIHALELDKLVKEDMLKRTREVYNINATNWKEHGPTLRRLLSQAEVILRFDSYSSLQELIADVEIEND